MAKITYVEYGTEKRHTIEVSNGHTVMEGAVNNDIPGIEAICGGGCSCSTCHVYVEPTWLSKLPAQTNMEKGVIQSALDVRDNSRLACQIEVTDELEGLVVHMPEEQAV